MDSTLKLERGGIEILQIIRNYSQAKGLAKELCKFVENVVMMRKLFIPLVALLPLIPTGCDTLTDLLSEGDIAQGLKEALRVGTDTSVAQANTLNGYFGNQAIKILLPPEAEVVQSSVGLIPGGQQLIDEVILKMNRAAEQAAVEATPIFVNAITSITFQDAQAILQGPDDAATTYLANQTKSELYNLFQPDIEQALESVGIQSAWETLISGYNSIPFVNDINPDLAGHTTDKALDGLYHLIAEEESKIRNDVSHQVNDLLRKVFG